MKTASTFVTSLSALTLAAHSFVHAQEDSHSNHQVMSYEKGYECCYATLPSARMYPEDCWGVIISVDALLWQGHIGGAGIAIETKNTTDFFNAVSQSRVRNLDFDWDWGVRVGLGLNGACDSWETMLVWTYWDTDASRTLTSDETNTNYPTWGHPARTFNQRAGSGKGKWKMEYNILDLENGKHFFVSRCLSLKPHAGLRTTWINQKDYDITYTDLSPQTNPVTTTFHSITQQDRSWGIGIRGGLDMQWTLGCGLSLFSNYAGSLLYSYHSVKHQEKGSEGDSATPFKVRNFFHVGNAIFDAQLGFRYQMGFCDCCYIFTVDLGWEHHWHPGQNQFMLFVDDGMSGKFVQNQGDLGIMGAFLRVRFEF